MAERGVQTDQQARNGDPSAVASKSAKALPPRPRHTSRERAREAYESRPRDGDELAARATTFPTAPAQFLFDAVAFLDQDLLQGGFSIRRRRQITHFIAVEIEKMYAAIGEVERQLVDVLFNLHTLYSKKVGQHEDIEFSSLSDEAPPNLTENKWIDEEKYYYLLYDNLSFELVQQLEKKLLLQGLNEGEAARASAEIVRHFRDATDLEAQAVEPDLDSLATMAAIAFNLASAAHAPRPDGLSLPSAAPEIWSERDRSKKETPIEFLNRVWGPYMAAGILYQDDIKRLGDPKLVREVRKQCSRHKMDAADVLPPPRQVRLDRALAQAGEGPEKAALLQQLATRERQARHRKRQP